MWRLVSPPNNLGYERAILATPLTLHPASSQLAGSFVPVRRTARKQIAESWLADASLGHRHTQPAYLQDPATSNFDRAQLRWPAKTGRGGQSPWCGEDVFRSLVLRPIRKTSAATTMSLVDVCLCFKHHPELGAGEADVISKYPRPTCPITTPPGQASGMSNLELFKLYHMCTKTPPSPSRHPQRHHTPRFNDLHPADLCISARFGNLNHALSALKRQCRRHLLCPSRCLLHSCRTREPLPPFIHSRTTLFMSPPLNFLFVRLTAIVLAASTQCHGCNQPRSEMCAPWFQKASYSLHFISFPCYYCLCCLDFTNNSKWFNCPWTVKHTCLYCIVSSIDALNKRCGSNKSTRPRNIVKSYRFASNSDARTALQIHPALPTQKEATSDRHLPISTLRSRSSRTYSYVRETWNPPTAHPT
jgi:hypothetical protein